MKLILSHPTGNNFLRELADRLVDEDKLYEFYTSVATFEGDWQDWLGGFRPFADLRRRRYKNALKAYTRINPWYEIGRMLSLRLGLTSFTSHESGVFSVDAVYHKADKSAAAGIARAQNERVDAIYAYEDAALESFKAASLAGLKCIYDLPIAHWATGRRLMNEESERLPAWSRTLGGGISDSLAKLERKDQELMLADMVVVPSGFVRDSLPEFARSKNIVVAPFGSPVTTSSDHGKDPAGHKPLRVLFAGSMGQRKGLGDLFAAVKLLDEANVELIVMGSLLAPIEFYRKELPEFHYEPGRAHNKVLELMRSCDIFCLPSIVEGRALVMQEAMSQGLPLIITPNTGGEDLIIEGQTGFLVPIRSPEIIAEKIRWFLDNRDAIPEMGRQAQIHAAKYTWKQYGERIVQSISALVD